MSVDSKHCTKCLNPAKESDTFCRSCGELLPIKQEKFKIAKDACGTCGELVSLGDKYCSRCGMSVRIYSERKQANNYLSERGSF